MTTKGGPLHATTVVVYYLYLQAFQFFHAGYAAAIASVLFLVIAADHADPAAPRPATRRRPGRVSDDRARPRSTRAGPAPAVAPAVRLAPRPAARAARSWPSPLLWMVITSVSTLAETRPSRRACRCGLHWAELRRGLDDSPVRRSWLLNSAIVSVPVVASNLVLCSLAGYAFARLRFPGPAALFLGILATLMVPVPGRDDPDAADRQAPAPGRHAAGARRAQPGDPVRDLPAAAVLQTATGGDRGGGPHRRRAALGILRKILLPPMGPPLATVGIMTLLWVWNDFLWPLVGSPPRST